MHMAARPGWRVGFLGREGSAAPSGPGGMGWWRYPAPEAPSGHPYLARSDQAVRHGQAVARACTRLIADGFRPDVVVAHPGWGEALFIPDILPAARLLSYCEYFYDGASADLGYIPETAVGLDARLRMRVWNGHLLLALDAMHRGFSPTAWQRDLHPAPYRDRIAVAHEGVDTDQVAPRRDAAFRLPDGRMLTEDDEVITYVARNLEPYRGFPNLVRALPELLALRPLAQVVICGGDGVSYGSLPPSGGSWRQAMQSETALDVGRVHFTGRLAWADYLTLLRVSRLHLYPSVPFVLSWSCIEAMSAGCVVLASDTAPVREVIVDGVNGFLVDSRDPAAIACRAAALLGRPHLLAPVRLAARRTVLERFHLADCLARQTALITQLSEE